MKSKPTFPRHAATASPAGPAPTTTTSVVSANDSSHSVEQRQPVRPSSVSHVGPRHIPMRERLFAECASKREARKGSVRYSRRQSSPGPEPLFDQRSQRSVGRQRRLRLADPVVQRCISLAHTDAEALYGDPGLEDL